MLQSKLCMPVHKNLKNSKYHYVYIIGVNMWNVLNASDWNLVDKSVIWGKRILPWYSDSNCIHPSSRRLEGQNFVTIEGINKWVPSSPLWMTLARDGTHKGWRCGVSYQEKSPRNRSGLQYFPSPLSEVESTLRSCRSSFWKIPYCWVEQKPL